VKTLHALAKPETLSDGRCAACGPGGHCEWHAQEGLRRDRELFAKLRGITARAQEHAIARVCARYELESDETGTREEHAMRLFPQEVRQ
jgi:hypothetical protein